MGAGGRNILSLDGETHHRLRRLVCKAFAPRGAERMRTLAIEVITELVDPLTRIGRCDVVTDIARRYPTPIICALLGAPATIGQLFSAWADDIKKLFDWNIANDGPAILAAIDQRDAYLKDMIARRRDTLTDDLISDLIRAEAEGDRLTHDELLMLAGTLLGAGTDTTRNQLAAAVQVLAITPTSGRCWRRIPTWPPTPFTNSCATAPSFSASAARPPKTSNSPGSPSPPARIVGANTASANRDPAVYHDPDQLDITRDDPPAMLTFGGGAHYCLGAHLARIELTEALRIITQRMPNPRRTQPATWKAMTGIIGPISVPLEFDTGR